MRSFADVATKAMERHSLTRAKGHHIQPGVLTVSEIRCRNIKATSKMSSSLKPYVQLTCGSVVRRTAALINVNDPYFTECIHIIVRDGLTAGRSLVFKMCKHVADEFFLLVFVHVPTELVIRVMDEYTWMDDVCVGKFILGISCSR